MFMPVFNDFNNLTSMKSFLAGFENVILTLILTIVHFINNQGSHSLEKLGEKLF